MANKFTSPKYEWNRKKVYKHKIKDVFISSLTFITRISHKLLNEVNEMIERVCLENGYYYIKSGNVYENDLFNDGLHLQNSGKKILSQNFIANLQTYDSFFKKRTWSFNIGQCETLV